VKKRKAPLLICMKNGDKADKVRRRCDKSTKGLLERQRVTPLSIVLHGPRAVVKNVQILRTVEGGCNLVKSTQ